VPYSKRSVVGSLVLIGLLSACHDDQPAAALGISDTVVLVPSVLDCSPHRWKPSDDHWTGTIIGVPLKEDTNRDLISKLEEQLPGFGLYLYELRPATECGAVTLDMVDLRTNAILNSSGEFRADDPQLWMCAVQNDGMFSGDVGGGHSAWVVATYLFDGGSFVLASYSALDASSSNKSRPQPLVYSGFHPNPPLLRLENNESQNLCLAWSLNGIGSDVIADGRWRQARGEDVHGILGSMEELDDVPLNRWPMPVIGVVVRRH